MTVRQKTISSIFYFHCLDFSNVLTSDRALLTDNTTELFQTTSDTSASPSIRMKFENLMSISTSKYFMLLAGIFLLISVVSIEPLS